MIRKLCSIFLLSLFFLHHSLIVAQGEMNSPGEAVATLEQTIDAVISEVQKEGYNLQEKKQIVSWVTPLFDFNRMTALAIGLPWREATVEQKITLKEAFKDHLINSYYKALLQIKGEQVRVQHKPLISEGGDGLIVRTFVDFKQGRPVVMDYALHRSSSGFRIYNITVAGISLVTAYRSEFSAIIRAQGIEGLIDALRNNKVGILPEDFIDSVPQKAQTGAQENNPHSQVFCDSKKNRFILLNLQQLHDAWLDSLSQILCAKAIHPSFNRTWKELM